MKFKEYLKELNKLEKIDLLILDDFGLLEFDSFARNALVDMIEDRHGRKSTIIASQLPIALWYEAIGEDTVAAGRTRDLETLRPRRVGPGTGR